jgi:hypothetical protein
MSVQELTCTCRILRYTPNLLREEHVNIGVLLHDPAGGRVELRLIESDSELARLRRLHPAVDLDLVRGLETELRNQLTQFASGITAGLGTLDETLSNTVQLSPPRAVLTMDFDSELERIYDQQVAPVQATRARNTSRSGLRVLTSQVLERAGVLRRMQRSVRVEEFTYPGDPMRLDYAFGYNGRQGFLHALSLERDPAQAKALAFTSERIRVRMASAEFTAVCESTPQRDNLRHRFVANLLQDQRITMVPLSELEGWARELGRRLN